MPYKDTSPYMRAWIERKLKPRIDRYVKKTGKKRIDLYTRSVDRYLTEEGF